MNENRSYLLKFGGLLCIIFILMLVGAKLGWAQSSDNAYRIESFSVSGNASVDVKTSGGSIQIIGKDTDEVTIEMYVKKGNKYLKQKDTELKGWEIDLSKSGNTVTASAIRESGFGWNWRRSNESVAFIVYAPRVTKSSLKTSGGSIKFENLIGKQEGKTSGGSVSASSVVGDLNVATSGGSITVNEITGNVDATTSGGRIEAVNIEGDVILKSSGGSITIESVGGSVVARTSGGSIKAKIDAPKGEIDLKTSGGSINITVPGNLGYDLNLRGSRVDASLENFKGKTERDEIVGSQNGGGISLIAKTSGGSVVLRYY